MAAESHKLPPAGNVVRAQPRGRYAVDTELGIKAVDKDVVVDGVERRRHVEADQSKAMYTVFVMCSSAFYVEWADRLCRLQPCEVLRRRQQMRPASVC